jgi:hypothetical protein
MDRDLPWVQVYEEATDDSGYEYVNPNVIMSAAIVDSEMLNDGTELIIVEVVNMDNNCRQFPFTSVKEAQRFIKRLGGVD